MGSFFDSRSQGGAGGSRGCVLTQKCQKKNNFCNLEFDVREGTLDCAIRLAGRLVDIVYLISFSLLSNMLTVKF